MVKQKQKTKKMRIPRSVQEAVPISTVYDDGLFVVDKNLYSQTYRFTDINYAVASYDDKMDMLKGYMALINSFDASASTKITVNNRIQDIRNCKYEMEVRCIKHVLSAGIHPHFLWNSLAHGTTTVTAGIIVNLNSTTVFAYTDVCTICPGFAVQGVPSDFCLFWRRRKLFKVCRIKTLENILNGGLIHSPRLLSCQMGFGFP